MINEILPVAISLTCLVSLYAVRIRLRRISAMIPPRYPRMWPMTDAEKSAWIEFTGPDFGSPASAGAERRNEQWVLVLSTHCPVCRDLFIFLGANHELLSSRYGLMILSKSDKTLLQRLLGSQKYFISGEEAFFDNFSPDVIPMLYIVKNQRIVEKYLVNTGDELMALAV